jgi:hypothetical protein
MSCDESFISLQKWVAGGVAVIYSLCYVVSINLASFHFAKRIKEKKWREIERRGREREKEEAARDKLSRLQKKGIKAWETYGIFRLFCIF